ncbi:MAG: AAA family ATPase [Candidatus Vogelbacteria bacterium RIFOXYD1_FULL_42_15]|uniref:AAA family ATPase n=1 Tax=Candidatus Vogelbacteria bacterium RIFOXYD1_FULL_42_15 TaxID=1802437 RepID=A0A1G2QHC1_9BACT|nr:MAG: AAA family ATPase [Candidatus Vogelbacteria bacterium RIFOXYD1_FULL_42_15]
MTQKTALNILKTGANVFLTGEPGSGKTYVVNDYVDYLRRAGIETAITASTGIAATHIGGMTIHSWSGIGIKKKLTKYDLDKIATSEYLVKRIRRTKVLIIDEVSMISADTLTMVEAVCREVKGVSAPFGGLQVVLVGDFFQLPPIVDRQEPAPTDLFLELETIEQPTSHFSFSSPVWSRAGLIVCYLTEQHRQADRQFSAVLSAIRSETVGVLEQEIVASRLVTPNTVPTEATKLFSHNLNVDQINLDKLNKISGSIRIFTMKSEGREALVITLKKSCLSPERLELKIGARVMFTKNNQRLGFVNGTLGEVIGFAKLSGRPIVKTKDGRRIEVESMAWPVEENGRALAQITQLPLRLAWAITIHKSQGMSLDEAVIDLSQVFEFGQGYVALSRVRSLAGLHLLGWNQKAFAVHPQVLSIDRNFCQQSVVGEETFTKMPVVDLQKMHRNFILASGGQWPVKNEADEKSRPVINHQRIKKNKIDTLDETLALWRQDQTLKQIAQKRKLAESTIFSHLERLVLQNQLKPAELKRLPSPVLTKALPKIQTVFKELKTRNLLPVFEKMGGAYSYDDLRIARLLLED